LPNRPGSIWHIPAFDPEKEPSKVGIYFYKQQERLLRDQIHLLTAENHRKDELINKLLARDEPKVEFKIPESEKERVVIPRRRRMTPSDLSRMEIIERENHWKEWIEQKEKENGQHGNTIRVSEEEIKGTETEGKVKGTTTES
jgi:hypothetical protein